MQNNIEVRTSCHNTKPKDPQYPDYSAEIKRLNRIKGQVDGVEKMILARRYCPDIILQIRAAAAALKALEAVILGGHLRGCVRDAMRSKSSKEAETKIQEILKILE